MSSLKEAYGNVAQSRRRALSRNLTTNGLGDGPFNMAQNFSDGGVSPQGETDFFITPVNDEEIFIEQISLVISDAGAPDLAEFGNLGVALSAGLRFFSTQKGIKQYAVTEIFSNADIMRTEDALELTQWAGNVRVTSYKKLYVVFSDGFPLHTRHMDQFGVTLNDDFSSLTEFSMHVNGGFRLERVV